MWNKKNIAGQRFGRVTAVEDVGRSRHRKRLWRCLCDCGNEFTVVGAALSSGNTTSCGCYVKEIAGNRVRTHGMSRTPEYHCWHDMVRRCTNSECEAYKDYGGRGITVCERWMTFENFFADVGFRPSTDHTLDRINNDGNYEPGNWRWVTHARQCRNTRNTVYWAYQGETLPVLDWAEKLGIPGNLLRGRVLRGWPEDWCLNGQPEFDYSDMLGQTFGFWTVREVCPKMPHKNQLFRCECVCGEFAEIPKSNLISGGSKSCGCKKGVLAKQSRSQSENQPRI